MSGEAIADLAVAAGVTPVPGAARRRAEDPAVAREEHQGADGLLRGGEVLEREAVKSAEAAAAEDPAGAEADSAPAGGR